MLKQIIDKIKRKKGFNPLELEYIINHSDDIFSYFKTNDICILDFGNNILIDINSSIYNSLDEETSNNIGIEFLISNKKNAIQIAIEKY